MGDATAVSKTGADLLGNRRFESISLQRGVGCEPAARASYAGYRKGDNTFVGVTQVNWPDGTSSGYATWNR
jgi:hypothetical protein